MMEWAQAKFKSHIKEFDDEMSTVWVKYKIFSIVTLTATTYPSTWDVLIDLYLVLSKRIT